MRVSTTDYGFSFSSAQFVYKGKAVALSNVALLIWARVLWYIGWDFFLWHYLVPWLVWFCRSFNLTSCLTLLHNSWLIIGEPSVLSKREHFPFLIRIVMFTFLHHTDPTIPHYRKKEWTFLRGAVATVDRPLLGWVGRFFFHNISHDHVAHRKEPVLPRSVSLTGFFHRPLPAGTILWVYFASALYVIIDWVYSDNGPEITKALKAVLKESYNLDSTVSF